MIASGFANAGANVLLTSRDEKACKEAAESLQRSSPSTSNVHYVASNASTREGCKALANHAKELFDGQLDVLVNNAGTSWGEEAYDRESSPRANWGWDKVMDLNVKGMFYLSRECVPLLSRPNENQKLGPSRIINIGSVAGIAPAGQQAPTHAYDVSKAAVHHLTRKMAADLAPRGITVNAIAPGYVPSRMSKGLESYGATSEKITKGIPLGRMGNEHDMAGAAIYLSSKAGEWTTGVILNVDGGQCALQIPFSNL